MKSFLAITSLALVSLAFAAVPVHAAKLSLTTDGVIIDTGTGLFTLENPFLVKTTDKNVQPKTTQSQDGQSLTETYDGGVTLTITIEQDGKTIYYNCTNSTIDGKGFGINMTIPVSYAEGGKYALGEGDLKPIPGEAGAKDNLDQGTHDLFRILPASGTGFSLKLPNGWNKLQDNRFYNHGTTFDEQYIYLVSANNNETSFKIVVEDLPQPAPADAAAPAAN